MKRREFLRKTIAGAAALVSGSGVPTNWDWIPIPTDESLGTEVVNMILHSKMYKSASIWEAAVDGHWSIVKEWLRLDPSLIAVTDGATLWGYYYHKMTLLHLAVALNTDVAILKYMVTHGADVCAQFNVKVPINGGEGYFIVTTPPPLHFAVVDNSNVEVLRFLVLQGAGVNDKDLNDMTPLHRACRNPNVETFEYLVSQGADVNAKDQQGYTPILCAAGSNSNVEVLRFLVSQGADVHAKENSLDWTPLHHAAHFNPNIDVLQYLISQGADVFAKDRCDKIPLDVVRTDEHKRILREAMVRK